MQSISSPQLPSSDVQTLERVTALSRTRPVWLRVGKLFDGTSDHPVPDAHLVFDAEVIHFVGSSDNPPARVQLAEGQTEPDAVLRDLTALPCLIEAHAHLFLDGAPVNFAEREAYLKQRTENLLPRARARLPKLVQFGIGAMRDAGDKYGVGLAISAESKTARALALRDRYEATDGAPIPHVDSPGAAIHHRGRYGAFMGSPLEDHASPEACVAARVAEGADRIKLLVSGIINFKEGKVTAPPQMPVEEVRALVAAAKSLGRQTFAHASGTDGVENSIEGGVNTVEHGFFVTVEQLMKMRDRDIAWVPTFAPVQLQIDRAGELGWDETVVGHLKRIIDGHRAMLQKGKELGVKIVAGSDAGSCGVPHGAGFLDELLHMQHAGLSPIDILRSATGTSAAVLNFPENIGRLAGGCRSRMIFSRHDPLATVANLSLEKTILFHGVAVRCPDGIDSAGL